MPQLVILVAVAHHGEHQVLEDGLEVGADELPGCRMVHAGWRDMVRLLAGNLMYTGHSLGDRITTKSLIG